MHAQQVHSLLLLLLRCGGTPRDAGGKAQLRVWGVLLQLSSMDFYQLRLMLRLSKHLNPALKDPQLLQLSKEAAALLTSAVPSLDLQQLCWSAAETTTTLCCCSFCCR